MRQSAGARSAGAGSTTLPVGSIYALAASRPKVRELHVANTTTTAVAIYLARLTSTGTQGSGLTEAPHDADDGAVNAACFNTHTVAPTLGSDLGYRTVLGAAIGAGIIWTFGDSGLVIPLGVANGIGILVATGTGQILDWYVVWD